MRRRRHARYIRRLGTLELSYTVRQPPQLPADAGKPDERQDWEEDEHEEDQREQEPKQSRHERECIACVVETRSVWWVLSVSPYTLRDPHAQSPDRAGRPFT